MENEWKPFRRKVAVVSARQVGWSEMPIAIVTLEGTMVARPGDWIVRGIKGEEYPIRNDIFQALYEPSE